MNRYPKIANVIGVLAVGLATSSPAAIVFNGTDLSIPTVFVPGLYVDIDGGTSGSSNFAGADANFFFGGSGLSNDAGTTIAPTWQPVRVGTDFLDAADNLAFGSTVGPSSTFALGGDPLDNPYGGSGNPNSHVGTDPNQFMNGVPGYLGFSLQSGGDTLYGWMEVVFTDNSSPGSILGYAYEDSGAPIAVGAIPEPTVPLLGLLALGGLALRRRR